jgi:hypothetical protein
VWPGDKGVAPSGSVPASREISGAHRMDLMTQVDGLVVMEMTEVLHRLLLVTSGHGRQSVEESSGGGTRSVPVAQNPSK